MNLNRFFLILLNIIFTTCPLYSATIHVPSDYTKIQDAIDAAKPGDTVLVEYGEYIECITMKEGVDLTGIEDPVLGKPIIRKAPGAVPTVRGADNCTIDGFYLTANGTNYPVIDCNDVSPTISNCFITAGNEGIGCYGSASPEIISNTITENSYAGIACYEEASPVILKNKIEDNPNFGITSEQNGHPDISYNLIVNNYAGIICFKDASPNIGNNFILKNSDFGIYLGGSNHSLISNNFITTNYDTGIYCIESAEPTIFCNTILKNVSGIDCYRDSIPNIKNNLIINNKIYGLYCDDIAQPQIFNNTIINNQVAGIGCFDDSNPEIANNVVVKNFWGIGVEDLTLASNIRIKYNDVWKSLHFNYFVSGIGPFLPNPGTGEISQAPLFIGPEKYDYKLSIDSPCIDAGDPDPEHNDPDGTRNDMGCYGGPDAGWIGPNFLVDIGSFNKSPADEDFFETDVFYPGETIDLKMQFQNKDEITIDFYLYIVTPVGDFYYPTWTPIPTPIHLPLPAGLIEYFSFLQIPIPEDQPPGEFSFRWYSINTDTDEKIFPEQEYTFKIAPPPM